MRVELQDVAEGTRIFGILLCTLVSIAIIPSNFIMNCYVESLQTADTTYFLNLHSNDAFLPVIVNKRSII